MRKTVFAKQWSLTLMALVLMVACTASHGTLTPDAYETELPVSRPIETVSFTSNKLGVHMLLDDGRNNWSPDVWPAHLEYARRAVGDWGYVIHVIRLDDLDPNKWQVLMDLCAELHLTPILRLATIYDREDNWWIAPPRDDDGTYSTIADQYVNFLTAMDWPTDEHFVIVGNEPNHGNEWGGRPDPEAYARFLIDVADAVHAADADARVLNAGFDPYTPHTGSQPFADGTYNMDAETFLDEMFAAYPDTFDRLDAWASHAYTTGPFTEGPWAQTYQVDMLNDAMNPDHVEPPPGIYNRGVNGYEWELFKLSTYGVGPLPVLITETGWRHAESVDPESLDGGVGYPDAETVAVYLDLALHGNGGRYPEYPEEGWRPWLDDERVEAVIFFAFDGLPAEWGYTNWLQLDAEGNVLGTYAPFDLLAGGEWP